MSETHKQRLQRLTELARKVWPDRNVTAQLGEGPDEIGAGVLSDVDDDWAQVVVVESHPRALDALEAALCALAGEPPRWLCEVLPQAVRDDRISRALASELLDLAAKGGAR